MNDYGNAASNLTILEADDPYASLPRDPYRGGTLFKERRVHGWCYGSDTVKVWMSSDY